MLYILQYAMINILNFQCAGLFFDSTWCFINKIQEEHDQIINMGGAHSVSQLNSGSGLFTYTADFSSIPPPPHLTYIPIPTWDGGYGAKKQHSKYT